MPGQPISEYHTTHSYRYDSPQLTVVMDFDIATLTDYTLDRLRASLVRAAVAVPFVVEGKPQRLGLAASELELVACEHDMLHLHLKGTVDQLNAEFHDVSYICAIGHLPTLCTDLPCVYTSGDAVPATVDAQVRIRLVPPTP